MRESPYLVVSLAGFRSEQPDQAAGLDQKQSEEVSLCVAAVLKLKSRPLRFKVGADLIELS